MKRVMAFLMILTLAGVVQAKVDLTTLPTRDAVQLTIYNSADLTLARESRALTLKEGANALQFSWENTLIDPTSLEMLPKANADAIDIAELIYPPRVRNVGLWNIASEVSGKVPVEITYLTSGLTWRAFYMGTLSADEKTMRLQGYVRVTNNSGEDYENAQVRVIVGKVHLLDEIAELARREYPYGRPGVVRPMPQLPAAPAAAMLRQVARGREVMAMAEMAAPKEIVKEGLSEYFLYTIEGTETIPNGWSKRLQSFDVEGVPVVNLYKYEVERYGDQVMRFLSFTNDTEHKLGETPIPDGTLKVYRGVDDAKHLSYEGQSSFKYIPVGEEVELNLGAVADVVVEPKRMEVKTDNYRFDRNRNVAGWDSIETWKVEVRNTRDVPVKVEIRRNFDSPYWDIARSGSNDGYEKVDLDTVRFTIELAARSQKTFEYTTTLYQGVRTEDWQRRSR
ncbi:MAG TPA: DUF4139 domain-containing protein [Sedimentisphaerales bacterium]|nr:DUF4139 domain-containing protein [Sedimentisphaerales bacterium]HRS10699.1 DUF4139 domain-containing protein [Sedimentisphaerales bacterium]HRV47404.1 DUF4139 domain-containing protein [Sedimentisphaerales bacterium]